jgi:1-acyl-sn-glycerol-3-phosphate acyltransferase
MALRLNTALPGPVTDSHPQREDPNPFHREPTWGEKLTQSVQTGLHDLTDPAFFGPMMVAQGVFGLTRWGLLKTLPQTFSKGGALAAANLGAFGLEGLSFAGSQRGFNHLLGHAVSPDADFTKELGHAYLTLGLLKGLGGLTQSALQMKYHKIPTSQLGWQDRLLLKAAPHASTFGGIYSSHTLAPYLNLGEYMDPSDRLFQSAVMAVHFGAAGHMMNRIPGYHAFNQKVHLETRRLIQGRWESLRPMEAALTTEGIDLPIPKGEDHMVHMSASEGVNGKRPSLPPPDSIPPPPSIPPPSIYPNGGGGPDSIRQSLRPPSSNGNGHGSENGNGNGGRTKLKDKVGGLGVGAKVLSRLEILNRFSDPQQAPLPVERELLPVPVKSVEDGRLRAMARGLGERQVWHLRRILDHTRDLPETQGAYLEVERARQAFQSGMRKRLDPILGKFKTPSLRAVQDGVVRYRQEIERVLGQGTPDFEADALVNLFHARRMADPEFRAELSEADLIGMGYEPKAFKWARNHGDKYWPGALEALIRNNPDLAAAPGAEKVIEAARNFRLEVLDPENLAEKGGQLKSVVDAYLEKVAAGTLTLSETQQVQWGKVRETAKNFDPKKITSPKGKESQAALETAEELFSGLEDFFRSLGELPPEWAGLKRAKEEFPSPTAFLQRGMKNMISALSRYLRDEKLAPLWLSETALHHSLREMMRRKSDTFLREVLLEVQEREVENLPPEEAQYLAKQVEEFSRTRELFEMQKLWAASGPYSNIHGLLDGLARLVGRRDFGPYHRAQGAYERAVQDMLIDYESFLIPAARRVLERKLESVDAFEMDRLAESRERLMNRFENHAQEYQTLFQDMEPEIAAMIEHYDATLVGLREKGMRVGILHLKELTHQVGERSDNDKLRSLLNDWISERERHFELLVQGNPGEIRGKPIDPKKDPIIIGYFPAAEKGLKGMINPRDLERNTEEPLKLVMEGYEELKKIAREHGVKIAEIHPILPMFEPYAFKHELLQELRHRLPFAPEHRFDKELPKLGFLKLRDWERARRMARYGFPALGRILRIGSIQNHGYPFAEGARQFLDFGSSIGERANRQTFYTQEGVEEVADYFRFALSADHNAHLDFIGNADNVVQAMLGPYAHRLSITDIIAKLDLKIPVIDTVFPYLTNMIGYWKHQLALAFQRASRMQALGELEFERMIPTMPLGYDNITMDITNGEGPYVRDPASAITGSLPVMGRLFGISEGAAVLTGRPQGMTFVQDPGALRNFPAQRANDRKAALLNNPSSMATLFVPTSALPEPRGMGKITYRNNLERLIWFLQAFHPELDPGAPETDALFYQRYKKPMDPESERIIAELYAGAGELYPSAQTIRELDAHRQALDPIVDRAVRTPTPDAIQAFHQLGLIHQALDLQTRQLMRTRLTVLDQQITMELDRIPHTLEAKGLRRRQRMIQARLETLESVEEKLSTGEALSLTEQKFLEKATAYYSGQKAPEARDPLLDQVEFYFAKRYPEGLEQKGRQAHPQAVLMLGTIERVIELASASGQPFKPQILPILKNREQKLHQALARYNLGEPLTPVDQIIMEDLIGANSREEHNGPRDHLVSALLNGKQSPEGLEKILRAEEIRESTRSLIEKLPGGGRGTIDNIAEAEQDPNSVSYNAQGEIIAGPRNAFPKSPIFFVGFLSVAGTLGVAGAVDLLTFGKLNLYSSLASPLARGVLGTMGWRPVLRAQDVRAREEFNIIAHLENRAREENLTHASWSDIAVMKIVSPEGRYVYKKSLLWWPFLNLALLGGRHPGMTRPTSKDPATREKQSAQAQKDLEHAGEMARKHHVIINTFTAGHRSRTGTQGSPKTGGARIALGTNAVTLATTLLGTDQFVEQGLKPMTLGTGVDRRIFIYSTLLDPQKMNLPEKEKQAVVKLTHETQRVQIEQLMEQIGELRRLATEGDAMARGQLAELIDKLKPGMDLIRKRDLNAAKEWCNDDHMRTDFNFLTQLTEWWDRQAPLNSPTK